ncbi:tryptophan-rich sensory protein [Flavobacteriaceae bacterium 3-367]|uniref:tryptophan-rich sensory protein n=1 Tax=Eudoraea algarum TaxID=3417568 RepID=UPI00328E74F9
MKNILHSLSWIDSVAGAVWILLTLIMIGVLYQIYRRKGYTKKSFYLGLLLLVLIWSYPLYTNFFDALEIGMAGNIFTLLMTVLYMVRLKTVSIGLSKFMIPQAIWLSVASLYVGLLLLDKY